MTIRSTVFIAKQPDLVRRCTASIQAAAVFFLRTAAQGVLSSVLIEQMEGILRDDLSQFAVQLRKQAVVFGEARRSILFWELIDALNFLLDATSDFWPYLTEEGRLTRLGWAEQGANMVSHQPLLAA